VTRSRWTGVDTLGPWIAIALLGAVLALGVRSTIGVVSKTSWVDHTHRVIEAIEDLTVNVSRVVVARRGYALNGDATESVAFTRAVAGVNDWTCSSPSW